MKRNRNPKRSLHKHSLRLAALAVVVLLIVLYPRSNPDTHIAASFGNAIADWTGVLITVVMTKHLYEKGSAERQQPKGKFGRRQWNGCASTRSLCFFWSRASPG
jgi:hypothetical protein